MDPDTLLLVLLLAIGLIFSVSVLLYIWTFVRILLSKKWHLGPAVAARRDWMKSRYGILVQGVGIAYLLVCTLGLIFLTHPPVDGRNTVIERIREHPQFFIDVSYWFTLIGVALFLIGVSRIFCAGSRTSTHDKRLTLRMRVVQELMVPTVMLCVFWCGYVLVEFIRTANNAPIPDTSFPVF